MKTVSKAYEAAWDLEFEKLSAEDKAEVLADPRCNKSMELALAAMRRLCESYDAPSLPQEKEEP